MIKKVIRQMLIAQVLSALMVSLCLLIDNIMIGNFIGVDGLTAYGLANPLLLFIGAVGTMLSAGVQVVCSCSLGKGDKEETDRGYSSAIAVVVCVSLTVTLLVVLFRTPIATFLGAHNPRLIEPTGGYLLGFAVGALGSMGALILVPFLQMAGKSKLLIFSVLGMTVTDIVLDYVFSVTLKLGMLGMGLASSTSYFVALLIGGHYFFTKGCVFRFSFAHVKLRKILELLRAGIPTVISLVTTVALTFAMNRLLMQIGNNSVVKTAEGLLVPIREGAVAVAAFSVVCTIGNAANCISTGAGGVALTLSSMFYHEEDRTGLREQLTVLMRCALGMGIAMTCFIMLISPFFVNLFIPQAGRSRDLAILGARWYACGLTFCCVNSAIRSTWQGCEHILLTEVFSVLEGFLLPTLAALLLGKVFGLKGIWCFYVIGEALAMLGIWLYVSLRGRSFAPSVNRLLMLGTDWDNGGDGMEVNIVTLDDVMDASRNVVDFCLAHGQTAALANKVSLCVEEMGTNVVNYGFSEGEGHGLNIRILHKPDRWILRFRDDCRAFDPISYLTGNEHMENLGIRMLVGLSSEIHYTYSLNLNSLTIVIK